MSNPKEKASELVWKYYHNIEHTISNEYASKDWEIAKQCALIAVEFSREFITGDLSERFDKTMYLLEIKEEILKL
jgi:hypothetical protein